MFLDGNILFPLIFRFVFLYIGKYGFLIFAMGSNQHVSSIEYLQQAVHLIYQHIAGT